LFSLLADKYSGSVDWQKVHFFWGDERCVPPDDIESNYGTAYRLFLSKINIPAPNIHRIRGEEDPEMEAARYSIELINNVSPREGLPALSLIILGVGDDGHTASIFPGNLRLMDSEKICEAAIHPVSGQKRVTITGRVINNADWIAFLVTGSNKSNIVEDILRQHEIAVNYPVSYIVPVHGYVSWLLDKKAGKYII
jgi:6-phosphogluconolactonase